MTAILLSRRDFLKLGGMALAGLFIPAPPTGPGLAPEPDETPLNEQGRVTLDNLVVYDTPSKKGEVTKLYWRDIILPITAATIGDDETSPNRVWYKIGTEGYAHSGGIQPVKTILNLTTPSLPQSGALGEVTVPYTDACRAPDPSARLAYRLYYETTYWVGSIEKGADGNDWYRLYDDKEDESVFAPAAHLRIVPPAELVPISPDVPGADKLLEVHLNDQLVVAYEAGQPVFVARASTGSKFYGRFTTPPGKYKTYHKRPTRHMAAGNLADRGFDLPGVPWVSYITESGISFHGTFWHNDFGRPRSHGCVNLTPQAAKWIYLWTLPSVPVEKSFVYRRGEGTNVSIIE